ncbi:MAG: regulatory protein RecX [Anaerolineales bacterium]
MGGQISALEVQKRNKDRVNVFIDGAFAFGLHRDAALSLYTGQTLTDAQIEALQAQDTLSQAYHQTLRWLGRRPRSIAEVRRYLEQKDIIPSAIDEIIQRLEDLHYVDDLEFARFWVRNREEFNPRGRHALRYELRQKGIDSTIIDTVLQDVEPTDSAHRAAEKKLRTLRHKDHAEIREKLYAFLVRRGFAYDVVRPVVDDLLETLGDDENDENFGDEQ